jgi:hypothetical protein
LYLDEVGRQLLAAEAVEEGQGGREGRNGDAPLDGSGDGLTPGVLTVVDGVLEEVVEEKVAELRVLVERRFDVAQKHAANETVFKS